MKRSGLTIEQGKQYIAQFATDRSPRSANWTWTVCILPFLLWLGDESLSKPVLMAWRSALVHAKRNEKGVGRPAVTRAPATRNRILGSVRAFLNWARKMEYIHLSKDDIYDTLERFPVGREAPEPLADADIVAMLRSMTEHEDRPRFRGATRFLVISLLTGARPGEVKNLRWRDVDWQRRTLKITESKNHRVRVIPFDSDMLERFLRAWWDRDAFKKGVTEDDVIGELTQRTNPQRIYAIFEAAGLDITPKALRTTAVAYYASARSGVEAEYMIESRFGHTGEVSRHYYRSPIWEVRGRGPCVEHMYGREVVRELERVLIRERNKANGKSSG